MRKNVSFLSHYPLDEHYRMCRLFLVEGMDWESISHSIQKQGVIYFDISHVVKLFPHLTLDKNYRLICYLSYEYHGIWGHIVAINCDFEDVSPIFEKENEWLSTLFCGPVFSLPSIAADPMEAIYNDGSHEGYLEAVLCRLFLNAIPYTRFEQDHWHHVLTEQPSNFSIMWDIYMDIPNWTPRAIAGRQSDTILLFRREIENGFGSSSGRDRIYLSQYSFMDRLALYHATIAKRGNKKYPGKIDDDSRYHANRRCCVFSERSILVSEEIDRCPGY